MKIALLSFEYPPDTGFGGIGSYTWYQARGLAKLGHEVHVLAGASAVTPQRTTEHDGVAVHRLRTDDILMRALQPLGRAKLWWSKNRLENALNMYRGLRALRRAHRFDVIEMPECGAEGLLINHVMHETTVVRFHSPARLIMPYYDVPAADVRLCGWLEQVGIRGAQAFTSCSQFLANEVRTHLGVTRPIDVITNGIDLDLFDASNQVDFRAMHGLPRDRPIVFFAGRMEHRKGIALCREIAATILQRHEVAFVMAGQDLFDIMKNDVLPYVNAKALVGSFHYVGKLDLAGVRSGVCQSDIFLLPSLWENCPYSCLEAMAAGRAIVSTDQGGMPELITDGVNGLLARSGDASAYVAQLDRLIGDASLRRRLGEAARGTVVAHHTDTHTAAQAVALYANVVDAQHR